MIVALKQRNAETSASPENQPFETAKGTDVGVSYATVSRVLISTFNRRIVLPSSANIRKRNFGPSWLWSNFAEPSQGSSTARNLSRIGPTGPVKTRTRSMSSE